MYVIKCLIKMSDLRKHIRVWNKEVLSKVDCSPQDMRKSHFRHGRQSLQKKGIKGKCFQNKT